MDRQECLSHKVPLKTLFVKWAAALEALLLPFGGWGLGVIAFFDSAFLPLPHAIDLWVITLCIKHPNAMTAYAGIATLGSVTGCLILYYMARRGGHAFAERKVGKERLARIRTWFEKFEFLTVLVPAVMPPPTPFKAFIITAGVVEVAVNKFLLALLLGRAFRYFAEGFLAVRYGDEVWAFMTGNGFMLMLAVAASLLLATVGAKVQARYRMRRAAAMESEES